MEKVANITVAIPTLDRPGALSRCLEGLFNGRVLPAEVLVIDQGQNQTAEPVISNFRSCGIPITHTRQPRKGLSAARNLASTQANYPMVAFTDDDCVPNTGWVACIEQTFISNPTVDGVTGSILPLGPESPGQFAVSVRNRNKETEFRGRALPWKVGSGGNFVIKREWLSRVGGYDERLGAGSPGQAAEDMDLFYRLLQSGAVIRYDPKVVIYHERQDRERLLRSFWSYSYGLGAFCAKHLRRGDLYAGYVLGVWSFWLSWRAANFLLDRNGPHSEEGLLSLKGCTHGLAYGFKLR